MIKYSLLSGVIVITSSTPALAYIDPVSGSVVIQALIGGAAAALVAIRRVRERIVGFFRGDFSTKSTDDKSEPKL